MAKMAELWRMYPDLRLGQFITHLQDQGLAFNTEDDEGLKLLEGLILEETKTKYGRR